MKKLVAVLGSVLALVLIFSFTACSRTTSTTTAAPAGLTPNEAGVIEISHQQYADLFNGKTLGLITQSYPAEVFQKGIEDSFKYRYNIDAHINIVYVDSLTDGLLMLRSGKFDALLVMRFTGRYLMQRNKDLVMYGSEDTAYSTHMIFSLNKKAELERVNAAIQGMQDDGTLDKLTKQWITDLPVDREPSGGAMPVISGAETLKVGISGDEPPLDYIAADGTPGGFNVAVLSEIGRRANLNLSLVTVNSSARFSALQSGKIDSFLWYASTQELTATAPIVTPTVQPEGSNLFLKSFSYLYTRGAILSLIK